MGRACSYFLQVCTTVESIHTMAVSQGLLNTRRSIIQMCIFSEWKHGLSHAVTRPLKPSRRPQSGAELFHLLCTTAVTAPHV